MSIADKLRQSLDNIAYMPNACAAWNKAHGGNRALSEANAAKVEQAEKLLAEVLASLTDGLVFQVVGVNGNMQFNSEATLIAEMAKHGFARAGSSGSALRPELQNRPTFVGLCGPMYGSAGVVRYETAAVNDALSR